MGPEAAHPLSAGGWRLPGRRPGFGRAPDGLGPLLEEEARIEVIQPPSITRGGALGTLAAPQARPRRRDGKGAGSRRQASVFASPADLAPGAACWLGALKASGGFEAGGGCFPGGFTALAEGILKSHRQEGKQHSRNYKDKVLTHLWRCTSSVSTAGKRRCCSLGTPSSCGAHRSLHGAGRSIGRGDQRRARLVKRPRR